MRSSLDAPVRAFRLCPWFLFLGIIFFSGSLYLLPLSGISYFGVIAPIGGLFFMLGWLSLVYGGFKVRQVKLKGDRIGLIVFAGSSHLYLPLTSDYEATQLFLDAIDTKMIPNQGTDLSTAIRTAMNVFDEESDKYKVMVVVTDGEDHEGAAIELASTALNSGIITHSVGVGTEKGSLIPVNDKSDNNRYKRDKKGILVTSKLNENMLIELANAGGGIYSRFNNRDSKYKEILTAIEKMEKKAISTHIYTEFEDRYQGFASISLLLLALGLIMPTKKKNNDND